MSTYYRKFLALLEKWPIDKSKPGRDLGEHLRKQLKEVLGQENIVAVNEKRLGKQLESLERIASETYAKQYPRKYSSTSTGLTPEQLRQIRSEDFQRYLYEQDKPRGLSTWFKKKQNPPDTKPQ